MTEPPPDATTGVRGGEPTYTVAEAAERTGIPVDDLLRLNLASGFAAPAPEERVFNDEDVKTFATFKLAREFFGEDAALQMTRVIGSAAARIADALISNFALNVGAQSTLRPLTEEDFARANATALDLIPAAMTGIEGILRRHLAQRSRSMIPQGAEFEGVDVLDRAVGFCDLVGYTALSQQVSTTELSQMLTSFENRTADIVTNKGGSVVKQIGDEAMFVAPDAETACEIACSLIDAHTSGELPSVRIGLAHGRVIMREGDYFGAEVNIAARLVKLAAPNTVLAPSGFAEVRGFKFLAQGSPTLKGFDEPVPVVTVTR